MNLVNRSAFLAIIVVSALFCQQPVAAQQLTDDQRAAVLAEAQAAYERGLSLRRTDEAAARSAFSEAAARFEQLIDDGVHNGSLLYNLGNAQMQAGELGRAILSYRAGLEIEPSHDAQRHNLEYARSLRRTQIAPSGQRAIVDVLTGWRRVLTTQMQFIVFVACYVLFWCAAALLVWHRAAGLWLAIPLGLASLVFGASVAADVMSDPQTHVGVVIADEVVVRKGGSIGFEPQLVEPLREGVEFDVIERRADWVHIELVDGKTGWIPSDAAGFVDDLLGRRSM